MAASWARVQWACGDRVVALVPVRMPCWHAPLHGFLGVGGNGLGIGVGAEAQRGLGGACIAPEHGEQLLAGDGFFGSGAVGDGVLDGPFLAGGIPGIAGYGIGSGSSGQNGPHLGAGNGVIGGEGGVGHAAHEVGIVRPEDGGIVPIICAYIGEGLGALCLGRVALAVDNDGIIGRMGEAQLGVAVVTDAGGGLKMSCCSWGL